MNRVFFHLQAILVCIIFLISVSAGATTYYIDFTNGVDSANGTSKSTPWQHHPYMTNVWTGSYTHSAGDKFIFKGATTWPQQCFAATGMFVPHGGTSAEIDYYGVDQTWYAGSSWTRPKFDGQFVAGAIINLNASDSTGSGGVNWITVDSFEMCDIQRYTSSGYGVLNCGYACNCTFTNLFIHDWFFPAANGNGAGQDNADGGYHGFYSGGIYPTNIFLLGSEIENANQGPSNMWNGFCVAGCGVVSNCLVHDNGGTVDFAIQLLNSRVWNSGYPYTNYDQDFHIDTYYMDLPGGGNPPINLVCSGNYIWNEGGQNAGLVYPNTDCCDCYIYNNVLFGAMSTAAIFCDTAGQGTVPTGGIYKSIYTYNNTVISPNSGLFHLATRTSGGTNLIFNNFFATNNFFSGSGLTFVDAPLATWSVSYGTNNNLLSLGTNSWLSYLGTNYVPLPGSPVIGVGANLSAVFTTDLAGNARPALAAWDIGALQHLPSVSLQGGGSVTLQGGGNTILQGQP